MLRRFIYKDTETGEELVMPVTPKGYDIDHGRKVTSLIMHQAGEVTLPGEQILLNQEFEYLLPAQNYSFAQEGAVLNPFVYVEKFSRWSDAGTVLRFIISGTPVNGAVLLGPIRYGERDGTNDLYMTVPMRGYRHLTAETRQKADTGNAARAQESRTGTQAQYVVVSGDTLSGIARRFYGDASLYTKLAAANNIANPHLIYPGQVLVIPDVASLPAAAAPSKSAQLAAQTQLIEGSVAGGRPQMVLQYVN